MKIYVDIVMIINFFLDYLLLLSVSIVLKRNAKMFRIILGAFVGGLSIIALFININTIELFFIKVFVSILMILIAFGYQSIKYTLVNFIYLYIISIFLGGSMYLINNTFAYDKKGMVFINKGYSINLIVLIFVSPIIIYLYNKQAKVLKHKYDKYYKVKIYYDNKVLDTVGYLDTGNTLTFNKKMVLLLDKRENIFEIKNYLLIPYQTIDNLSILKGFKPDKVIVNGKKVNSIIALIDSVNFDGCSMILNERIEI